MLANTSITARGGRDCAEAMPAGPRASPVVTQIAVAPTSAQRRAGERFLEAAYRDAFASDIPAHYPYLMCALDRAGIVCGAVGYRLAGEEALFLEHYLDAPVEQILTRAGGKLVARAQIAEIGTLACADRGRSTPLFGALAQKLQTLGCSHAAATATRSLRRIFRQSGFQTIELARADRARAPDGGAAWGRYYDFDPVVVAGAIDICRAPLARRLAPAAEACA